MDSIQEMFDVIDATKKDSLFAPTEDEIFAAFDDAKESDNLNDF